jgi:transglutaminase-like putative cysteine protease
MAKKAKSTATRKPVAKRSGRDHRVITIRARDDKGVFETEVIHLRRLERLAQEWNYILRARARWAADPDQRAVIGDRALNDLKGLGIGSPFLQRLALVERVEVELHAWAPAATEANRIHEAAADVPWEYLISAATRSEGRFQSLLITRLFRNGSPAAVPRPPEHVLFVESAPGRLKETYGFEDEEGRIRAAVDATGPRRDNMLIMPTPLVSGLKEEVDRNKWDAIHVTGVDTQQAAWFVEGFYDDFPRDKPAIWNEITTSSGRLRDGMLLREAGESELPVRYDKLAGVLVSSKKPPYVVTLNLYYSGARTARELVAKGAHAALGFLDEIDDELAELFFQAFYWAWCRPEKANAPLAIPEAFHKAWEKMRSDRLHGTAIVIWMGRSIFEQPGSSPKSARSKSPAKSQKISAAKDQERRLAHLERIKNTAINKLIQVDLVIDAEVSYSLLHNNRELLGKLTLTKLVEGPVEDIAVQVELYVGAESYPYRYTIEVLDEVQLALASEVKIPLTASLSRSLRERVHSTVYVKVTCGGRTACEETRPVTLIPVDEWLDDTKNNPWLPSFVLPRDPAILKIINASRRYLIGIIDDLGAGFDGYQQEDAKAVDKQVQAVWTALVNEYRFQYINPPPAYSNKTQRLRTPSEIVGSNSGTCIDLALLLASCLEYIGIYPVVVLLTGHAFVGYWRSETVHDEGFASVQTVPPTVPAVGSKDGREAGMAYVDPYGWRLRTLNYAEIMAYVMSGDLVMLEATYLTGAYNFSDAIKEGRANLRSRTEFDSLLDIQLARTAAPPVTPLPIIQG